MKRAHIEGFTCLTASGVASSACSETLASTADFHAATSLPSDFFFAGRSLHSSDPLLLSLPSIMSAVDQYKARALELLDIADERLMEYRQHTASTGTERALGLAEAVDAAKGDNFARLDLWHGHA